MNWTARTDHEDSGTDWAPLVKALISMSTVGADLTVDRQVCSPRVTMIRPTSIVVGKPPQRGTRCRIPQLSAFFSFPKCRFHIT